MNEASTTDLDGSASKVVGTVVDCPDFSSAARTVLAFLHDRIGFDLWIISRASGADYVVLEAEDHGYGVKGGDVFKWTESLCHRMATGMGPRIAVDVESIPAYASAPVAKDIQIGAYVGMPLLQADGTLFGTMCAINPTPKPRSLELEQPLVELLAGLLGTILRSELLLAESNRRADRAQSDALRDELTGTYNRRGWEKLLTSEETRCRRYGHPGAVMVVDLDDLKVVNDTHGHAAGDAHLRGAAGAILRTVRAQDIVARIGGDEFAILAVEIDQTESQSLLDRIEASLREAKVPASIGLATRDPAAGFQDAYLRADKAMYREKHTRKR